MASKGKKEKKRIGDDCAHTSEELDNGTKQSEYFLRGSSERVPQNPRCMEGQRRRR